jgi:hypothetical protein
MSHITIYTRMGYVPKVDAVPPDNVQAVGRGSSSHQGPPLGLWPAGGYIRRGNGPRPLNPRHARARYAHVFKLADKQINK